jgi:hypothetical protein
MWKKSKWWKAESKLCGIPDGISQHWTKIDPTE